jgi:hypothetical protein
VTSAYFPQHLEGYFEEDSDQKYTLTADFIYDDPEKDIRVIVPTGFTSDFNSVPRVFWGYFPPWQYKEAGVVHDWLYTSPSGFGSTSRTSPLSRHDIDDIHRRILDLRGCRILKRQVVYGLLRSFGSVAWNKHRANDLKGAADKAAPEVKVNDNPHVSLSIEEKGAI